MAEAPGCAHDDRGMSERACHAAQARAGMHWRRASSPIGELFLCTCCLASARQNRGPLCASCCTRIYSCTVFCFLRLQAHPCRTGLCSRVCIYATPVFELIDCSSSLAQSVLRLLVLLLILLFGLAKVSAMRLQGHAGAHSVVVPHIQHKCVVVRLLKWVPGAACAQLSRMCASALAS